MMYKINKFLFHLQKRFQREESQKRESQKRSEYLSSQKFLDDMRRAVEKGAEEQTKIMRKAGMRWSNET